MDSPLLLAGDVVRLSVEMRAPVAVPTVHKHDYVLQPERTVRGVRLYRRDVVERWLRERIARLAKVDGQVAP
jgi:hypothetical protein